MSATGLTDPIQALQAQEGFASRAVQRLAEFLLAERDRIPSMSIDQVAREAETSQTTIVRLCKDLGYTGYRDFRAAMVESRGQRRGANLLGVSLPEPVESPTDLRAIAQQVTRLNADALSDTYRLLDYDALERCIDMILGAPHIHLVGIGSSAPVALDVFQRLLRFGMPASFHSDPHVIASVSVTAPPGCLFIGVSYSGASRDTVECLETVKRRRLPSIALTSFAASPAALAADVTLISAIRSADTKSESISSRISQLAILDILFVSLANRHPWKLDSVERQERELGKKRIANPG